MTFAPGYAFFDTAIGRCGVAWNARAIVALALPDDREQSAHARLRKRAQGEEAAPPLVIASAINAIRALLSGEKRDLAEIELDLGDIPDFHRRVYDLTRTIPPGRVMTYGEVARALGEKSAARAVGQALGANPCPIVVPCHRVVATDGRMHGFSAPGGVATKRRLLEIEGALAVQPGLFDQAD